MFASKDIFQTASSGPYTIARSVRLRSSATAYFNRTQGSPTNQIKWTWSGWVKLGTLGVDRTLFGAANIGVFPYASIFITSTDNLYINASLNGATSDINLITTAVYRDPSAWYHIVFVYDSAQATSTNRCSLYVNGVQVTSFSTATYPGSSVTTAINTNTYAAAIGRRQNGATWYFDGYLTEINFIDGQALTPSSFGETDSITGVWKPKAYSGTYGTNGFELNFSDNSNNTAATIGKDYSGNGNNWTPNNISVTSGVTYDSMVDSPTVGATSSNYCVINPLDTQNASSVAQGNQYISFSAVNYGHSRATMSIPDGSYWEVVAGGSNYLMLGVANSTTYSSFNWAGSWAIYQGDGKVYNNGAAITGVLATFTTNDVIGFAVKGNKLYIAKNNTWLNSGDPVAQTGSVASSLSSEIFPYIGNGGGAAGTPSAYFNAGQRPFSNTPPTGYVALNTYNLPASTITNGAAYMAATLYNGNGGTQSITNTVSGTSFQPDFVWIKTRSASSYHQLVDSVRGVSKVINSNWDGGESTYTGFSVTAFNSNGVTLVDDAAASYGVNGSTGSPTYIGWQWKAGGTSASNTNGSITSTVSVGATQGFSVVTYTGTGANATVGHGLGVAPQMVITKCRGAGTTSWAVYHTNLTSAAYYLLLNSAAGQASSSTVWNSTAPTSTVFSVGSSTASNFSTMVAYCFSAVAGYSAIGSYTGNSSTDGTFVYTGFRPRFVLIKGIGSGGSGWQMNDSSRNTYNPEDAVLRADLSNAETTAYGNVMDFLSNGFKLRVTDTNYNSSSTTYGPYIYIAFAENPFKYALAR